jgi:hypothetical protein
LSAPQYSKLADSVNVGDFEPRICNSMPDCFDIVADSELVSGMGSGAHADTKFHVYSSHRSFDSQYETQIGMAALFEGAGQPDSGLDRGDGS